MMDDELTDHSQQPENPLSDDGPALNIDQSDEKPANIFEIFRGFPWSDRLKIDEDKGSVKVIATGDFILRRRGGFFELAFFDLSDDTNTLVQRYKTNLLLIVNENLNPAKFINPWKDGYNLIGGRQGYPMFNRIFKDIRAVRISDEYKRAIWKQGNSLLLKPAEFHKVKSEVESVRKKTSSHSGKIMTYLTNQLKFDFLNEKVRESTLSRKGDFEFQVQRFNLKNKKKKEHFEKYLSESDTDQLGQLFFEMLRKKVFPKKYRTRLDDYFVRDSLKKIIKLGREILNLKSKSLISSDAKEVIRILEGMTGKKIGQFENLWQTFFEEYLLYLFFSYKKISPKIELKNIEDNQKKHPDFIGVNHYDGVDVIEIKTHLEHILVRDKSHDNFAFSSAMSRAIIQTINYMDAIANDKFQKREHKKELWKSLNVRENLSRPRGIIIISSKDRVCWKYDKLAKEEKAKVDRDFTKLRNSIHNIQIFTFSEILDIAKDYIDHFDILQITRTSDTSAT